MSLRTRLVVSLALTVAVALVVAGLLLVGLTRQALVDRVDRELEAIGGTNARMGMLQDLTAGGGGEAGRRLAIIRLDRQGNVQRAFPSGFASDPDPLPQLPAYPQGIPADAYGHIETRASSDGSVTYRVLLGTARAGSATIALAAPLSGVDEATRALVQTLA